jgi:hypothetical protein
MNSTKKHIDNYRLNGIVPYKIVNNKKTEIDLIKEHKDDYRLYGLVPYNISDIQKGIQFGHAVQELNNLILDGKKTSPEFIKQFNSWRKFGKTFIVLNGGTTNKRIIDYKPFGSLNQHLIFLKELGLTVAEFYEPDLGEELTAIVFILPKEVYNNKEFPDFKEYLIENTKLRPEDLNFVMSKYSKLKLGEHLESNFYKKWAESIGGEKNVTLRKFIKQFKFA